MDPSLGWIGPYHLERELGRGAMGAVYLARDPQRRSRVAIKVLAEGLEDDVDRARFEREVEALTKVGTHPGVVGLASAGTLPDGRPYLAMDYVEGEDLEQLLKRGLSSEKVVGYVLQVTSALGYAHELGLIHRDIKPGNVLIDADGERALLADFGLARFSGPSGQERLTMTGEVVGTPAYMAPEQLHPAGYGEPGPYTDVYAVGALLYFALTGRSANGEGSTIMMMANLASGERPAPLSVLLRDDPLGRRLGPVVDRALSVSPADRQQSASELSEELQAALSAEEPEPAPRSLVAVFVTLVVLAVLLAVGAAALVVSRRAGAGNPTPEATAAGPGDLAAALARFEAGDTLGARALLGAKPAPGAATILIASGDPAAALEAVGASGEGLDPRDWAQAAHAAGNQEQRLRALSRLEPGPAAVLATLQGDRQDLEDESVDQDWRTLVRAAQALRDGDLVSAKLGAAQIAEAAGLDAGVRDQATRLLIQIELGLGSPRGAARAWQRVSPRGTLDQARMAAWAKLIVAISQEAGLEFAEPTLEGAAEEALARGPGLSVATAARALSEGAPLPEGRVRDLLTLCLERGERWLALAELGLDPAGAKRSLTLLRIGRPAAPPRAALALARAHRLAGDLAAARAAIEEAESGPARALVEVQLQAQALEALGLPADLARMRSSSFGQRELLEGWGAVAQTLEAAPPGDRRLQLSLAAALAEQLESGGPPELRERARGLLTPLAGDPAALAEARATLARTYTQPDASPQDFHAAAEALADAGVALLSGEVPVAIRLEALRLLALLGDEAAAQGYLALCADLPARAWLEITTADYATESSLRISSVERGARLSRAPLQAATCGQSPPVHLARALLALDEESVERFASTRASLELLAQNVIDHPDTTNSVLLLLAWTQVAAQPDPWEPKTAASWVALALRDLIGERPSNESLRRAVTSCGAAIQRSDRPLPGVHLVRALCLIRLGSPDLTRQELAASRAGMPWSQAPWRGELNFDPTSEAALDGLVSRGGLRLSRLALDSGGLLRFSDEAKTKLLARCKEASQEGTWGPRMSAAILLQRVDDREFPLSKIQEILAAIEDPRIRRGAYALALEEMAEEHDIDPLLQRVAAQEALWSRPLGGASFGQAIVLELRDRVPFPRAPLWGGLVTEAGERKLRDTRPGSGERRYWRDCDLSSRTCLERMTYLREGPLFTSESLRDPDDLSRAFLSAPWDESFNTEILDRALKQELWGEAALALRRMAAFDAIDRPAESLAYQGQKRVLPTALQSEDPAQRAQLYALLASVVREGLRCGRPGTDRARLHGLRAEVSLFRALESEGPTRADHLKQAAADLAEARSRDVREGRRFYAHYRRAKVAILLGEPPDSSLQSASRLYRKRGEIDRRGYLRAVTNDPWRPRLEEHEGFREWFRELPNQRKRGRRGRRR